MSTAREPVPFEVYRPGISLHGTKALLAVGHSEEELQAMRGGLEARRQQGRAQIED